MSIPDLARHLASLRDAAEDRADLQAAAAASGASVAEICVASSRVGASTRPDGREGRRLPNSAG